jgi:hypothetical protein
MSENAEVTTEPELVDAEINPEFKVLDTDSEALSEKQKIALDNLNKLFGLKMELLIGAILDGLAAKYRKDKEKFEAKIANKKTKRLYQYDAGYLAAHNDIFNSLYSFLYTVKEQQITEETVTETDFDLFDAANEIGLETKEGEN